MRPRTSRGPSTKPKRALLIIFSRRFKGNVSRLTRWIFFWRSKHFNQFNTLCVCVAGFQGRSKAFHYPIQVLHFYLLLWNYLLILKMLTALYSETSSLRTLKIMSGSLNEILRSWIRLMYKQGHYIKPNIIFDVRLATSKVWKSAKTAGLQYYHSSWFRILNLVFQTAWVLGLKLSTLGNDLWSRHTKRFQ